MVLTEFERYVADRYQAEVDWYDLRSRQNKNWYATLETLLIVLSAAMPVLIAIELGFVHSSFYRWLPIVTAVIVAILASAVRAFKFQENWINYRTTAETLKKEIHLYRAGAGEYARVPDREALFVERVESLISRENTTWVQVSRREDEKNLLNAGGHGS